MKTMIFTALLLTVGSVQAASSKCWVVGQNAQNPNNYTELINYLPTIELSGKAQSIYQTRSLAVFAQVDSKDKMTISIVELPSTLSSVATGGTESVSLIDASHKISVGCDKN